MEVETPKVSVVNWQIGSTTNGRMAEWSKAQHLNSPNPNMYREIYALS